jgi:putative membrane protein
VLPQIAGQDDLALGPFAGMCASREAKGTTDALKASSSTADGNGVPEIARAHDDGLSLRRLIRIGPGTAAGEPHYRCERARPAQPETSAMKQFLIQAAGHALFAAALFSTTSTALAQSAQDFVNKVAISDMLEIQSSQLALSKQADEDTKPFAQKMVQDHQKTSSELKALVEGSIVKLTLPATMDSEHQKMLNDLQAKDGKDFDRTYDQIQLKAHQDAVALFEAYSKNGDNPELKSWAAATLPHLKEHLSMAEKLK